MKSPLSISSFKRFAAHAALFIAAVVAAQALVYVTSGGDTRVLPDEILAIKDILRRGDPVLYFGDSVTIWTGDSSLKTLPQLVQDRLPTIKIGTVTHQAYEPGIYLAYARYLLRQPQPPRLWIIPINLRSFSPAWDLRPQYQFEKEKILLEHDSVFFRIFFRPLSVFKAFHLASVKPSDFQQAPVFDGQRFAGTVQDFLNDERQAATPARVARMFLLNYQFALTADHRKVQQLVALCHEANERGIEPFFYLTPVDFPAGDFYLGSRFQNRLAENARVLNDVLGQAGCAPIDWSMQMDSEKFDWRVFAYPNEHLNEKGRIALANLLAQAVTTRIEKVRKSGYTASRPDDRSER